MAEHELAEAAESEATITSSHTMMGALPYLAPEMIRGPKNAGFGADVWAIGAIAFELLCGVKPFGGGLAQYLQSYRFHRFRFPMTSTSSFVHWFLSCTI